MTFKKWLDRCSTLKAELERLGCKVDISVSVQDGFQAVGQKGITVRTIYAPQKQKGVRDG